MKAERTVVRLVVGELESSELKIGQRLGLKMTPPPEKVDSSLYPADIDRPRARTERIEWVLASKPPPQVDDASSDSTAATSKPLQGFAP